MERPVVTSKKVADATSKSSVTTSVLGVKIGKEVAKKKEEEIRDKKLSQIKQSYAGSRNTALKQQAS